MRIEISFAALRPPSGVVTGATMASSEPFAGWLDLL